jgi:hypothetical protein
MTTSQIAIQPKATLVKSDPIQSIDWKLTRRKVAAFLRIVTSAFNSREHSGERTPLTYEQIDEIIHENRMKFYYLHMRL